jgi:hypothetical protein
MADRVPFLGASPCHTQLPCRPRQFVSETGKLPIVNNRRLIHEMGGHRWSTLCAEHFRGLGHPVYALSIVLFSLILSTGVGSLASERAPLASSGRLVAWSGLTSLDLFTLPAWLSGALFTLRAQIS